MEITDRCGAVEFVVRRATVADNHLHRQSMAIKIAPFIPKDDRVLDALAWDFLTYVTRTASISGLEGWKLPTPDENGEAIWAAFMAFTTWDDDLAEFWGGLVAKANQPLNNEKFVPDAAEKKSGPPSGKRGENPSSNI